MQNYANNCSKRYFKSMVLYCVLVLLPNAALADKSIDFAGFASLVVGKTTDSNRAASSGDYKLMNDINARNFSLLGLRMTAEMDDLSFVAQAVIYGKDDYKPKFDWAYMNYDIGSGWSVSLGRTRTPLFMYSMYQDVAYTYTWIKPPFSVYGIPQFKSVDGLKFRYQSVLQGDWGSDVQMWYGTIKERLEENGLNSDLKLKDNAGVAWDLERSFLRLHMVYMYTKTSIDLSNNGDLRNIMGGLDSLAGIYAASTLDGVNPNPFQDLSKANAVSNLKNDLLWQDRTAHFLGFGLGLDFNVFFFNGEATYINIEDNIAAPHTMQSYYLMFGVRPAAKWTLALTLTRDRDREAKDLLKEYQNVMLLADPVTLSTMDPSFSDLAALDSANVVPSIRGLQYYNTQGFMLTARWDFHAQASAKVEYMAEESQGDSGKKRRPQAIRIGVDLVF